jgi:long-chain-alcohol oxidase
VVNYSTSFRTPDDVRSEWASHGVPGFTSEDYTGSLDAVCERLGVNQEHNEPSSRDRKLQEGCVALGWHVDAMPRGVRRCAQGKECGYCGLGCRVGAKQSVVKTWLADANATGTRLVVRTKVERVIVESGAARGIVGRTVEGHAFTVRARAVIAACGAIHTPALLKRSGLQNSHIGRHLALHPATAVVGVFDEELKPWEGVMQALYSDQYRNLDDGYGLKYETAANHPHLFIPFSPWRGAQAHFALMDGLSATVPIGVLLRDRDGGEVAYEPGIHGSRAQFMADADVAGYGPGRLTLGSFHIMGSARMGGSPATSACDPTGQTWDVRDLYVLDGSSFPSASGVNPQISIQAIAHMGARGLASRLA